MSEEKPRLALGWVRAFDESCNAQTPWLQRGALACALSDALIQAGLDALASGILAFNKITRSAISESQRRARLLDVFGIGDPDFIEECLRLQLIELERAPR
jgi:hypothetical protein